MEKEGADFKGSLTEKLSRRVVMGARVESLQPAILQTEGEDKQSSN